MIFLFLSADWADHNLEVPNVVVSKGNEIRVIVQILDGLIMCSCVLVMCGKQCGPLHLALVAHCREFLWKITPPEMTRRLVEGSGMVDYLNIMWAIDSDFTLYRNVTESVGICNYRAADMSRWDAFWYLYRRGNNTPGYSHIGLDQSATLNKQIHIAAKIKEAIDLAPTIRARLQPASASKDPASMFGSVFGKPTARQRVEAAQAEKMARLTARQRVEAAQAAKMARLEGERVEAAEKARVEAAERARREAEEKATMLVTVAVPDGCYPGDEFTVEFDGRSFSVNVPDGCSPGTEVTVEVPATAPSSSGSAFVRSRSESSLEVSSAKDLTALLGDLTIHYQPDAGHGAVEGGSEEEPTSTDEPSNQEATATALMGSAAHARLKKVGLGAHADNIIAEGFDTIMDLEDLSDVDIAELAAKLGLGVGHKKKLHKLQRSPEAQPSSALAQLQGYEELKRIGAGGSGLVFEAKKTSSGKRVAIKVMNASSMEEADSALQEAHRMMRELQHPFLVEAIGAHMTHPDASTFSVHIIMELCTEGNLRSYIDRHHPLQEAHVLRILASIIVALDFVHAKGIVHRDIKPQNVLVGEDGGFKLGDFGIARQAGMLSMGTTIGGTPYYMSPEAMGGKARSAADIFALGVLAVELASGTVPSAILGTELQVRDCLRSIPIEYSKAFIEMIGQMLQLAPEQRPSAAELLQRNDPPIAEHVHVLTLSETPPTTLTNLHRFVASVKWMVPQAQVPQCDWQLQSGPSDVLHVYLADAGSSSSPASQALLQLILDVPGNERFATNYSVQKTVLARSDVRANQFVSRVLLLNNRYRASERALFNLEPAIGEGAPGVVSARRAVLYRFIETYSSLCPPAVLQNARVWVGFAAAPNEEIARKVLIGGFAKLSTLDPGFYGAGIYLTLDARYAIWCYGQQIFNKDKETGTVDLDKPVALLVTAVVAGNPFPVVEMPEAPEAEGGSYFGKPIRPKADAHLAIVKWGTNPWRPGKPHESVPCPPDEWEREQTYTEIICEDASVLPLGYVMVVQTAEPSPPP